MGREGGKSGSVSATILTCVCLLYHNHLYSKDVTIPPDMQRSMASEAEAMREARAKVSIN